MLLLAWLVFCRFDFPGVVEMKNDFDPEVKNPGWVERESALPIFISTLRGSRPLIILSSISDSRDSETNSILIMPVKTKIVFRMYKPKANNVVADAGRAAPAALLRDRASPMGWVGGRGGCSDRSRKRTGIWPKKRAMKKLGAYEAVRESKHFIYLKSFLWKQLIGFPGSKPGKRKRL